MAPMAAVVDGVAPLPVVALAEDAAPIAKGGASRIPWVVAIAAVGLASGMGLGLTLMRFVRPSAAASPAAVALAATPTPAEKPATPLPAEKSATPAAEPVAAAAPPAAAAMEAAQAAAAVEREAPASSSVIPWDDLPRATTKSCAELAAVDSGPKGVLLQQAVTSAPRALLKGDTAAAHAAFCTAAQLGATTDTVLLGLTQVSLMQADPSAALERVDQLLERAPTHEQALGWRGDILIRMGRVDEAREAWFKAAGATRASKRLIDNLIRTSDAEAKAALRSGDLSRADRMLRRAIALTPGAPKYCRELAAVLTKSGQTAAAERWLAYSSSLDS